MGVWSPAYVGVGSNIDDPRAQVLKAIDKLRALPATVAPRRLSKSPKQPVAPEAAATRVVLVSPLYGSKPFGSVPQPDFVNAVVGLLTQLDAPALLKELRAIEAALGRPEKHEKWGPRVIDLDLLVYAHERRTDPQLTLPHPGIVERNFVLYPLADIAPDLDVPGLGRVAGLKGRLAPTGLWPLSTTALSNA
jgi:2-amino-4-hydroxy-6-hydroxymethyldihydropteridine diphosphokinase